MADSILYRKLTVLEGLRVVDCCQSAAGLRATAVLADYGADVTWVEPPGGSPQRRLYPEGVAVFCRGKRSVQCDPATPSGRLELIDLLGAVDVFVEDGGPGRANEAGYGFEQIHALLPGLVYCSLSSFGPEHAHRGLPPHEALVHAFVGTMAEQMGFREGPIYENLPFASIGAAYLAQLGILAALHARRADGIGRLVQTSMLDGALAYLSMMWADTAEDAPSEPGTGRGRLIVRSYKCADDEYLGVHTGAAGAFGRLIQVLGLEDVVSPTTDGLDVGTALTDSEYDIVEDQIPKIFAGDNRQVWIDRLTAADVCAIPVLRPGEVFDAPQTRHNAMVVEVEDPQLGLVEQVAPPLRFQLTPDSEPATSSADLRTASTPGGSTTLEPTRDRPLLEGLKILDFGVWYASAYSSRLLADLGADVIKVEPVHGDQIRGLRRPFASAHARKRSFAADLKDPELRAPLEKLIRWADVVHHNMRPGVAERLGIGYARTRELNPDVIYVYGPGWGSSGPDYQRQSFAPLVSGFVGASYEVAGPFNPPAYPVGNEDPGSGMLAAISMLMALWTRRGGCIELPQLNAAMTHMAHLIRRPSGQVVGAGRLDPLQRRIAPLDGLYQTADSWICVVAKSDAEVAAAGRVLGLDQSNLNRESVSGPDADAVSVQLEVIFASEDTDVWLRRLSEGRVAAIRPVEINNARQFLTDPQNRQTGRAAETFYPGVGMVSQVDRLLSISDSSPPPFRAAPALGAHTKDVLLSVGLSEEEVERLAARGAITIAGGS